jgi:hypothetical protein
MDGHSMKLLLVPILCAAAALAQPQQPAAPKPTIAAKTGAMRAMPGYFPLYWDANDGKLWLEIGRFDTDFLYVDSLPQGMGSNDIGLDRGQVGHARVVRFERSGPRVLLVQPNVDYRGVTTDALERATIEESFAESVLWGFDVAAEENGRVLVDATSFFLHDAHEIPAALQREKQGSYSLDAGRSALYLPRTKNFPLNTEVEATLTFTGTSPGEWVRQVTPSPEAITVREHHSFVQLPEPGFKPRVFDPRAGFFPLEYRDYATPVSEPLVKRFIIRHRLEKKDPTAARSEPVKPIVYYLDPGVPEPIRSALLEGARWWNQAFEAAGYINAFRVELLPADADPMDVRYNLIQWVHRATRGWSYGEAIVDPRTGEIIKGQVTLGSLRSRQDYMIAEGLLAPYTTGSPLSPAMREMVLARMRQLAAHEVGHTLGLAHNFAASVSNRASVMDYPPPLATLNGPGAPDLSSAYAVGIGAWDKVTIAYGYSDFAEGTDEHAALDGILRGAREHGLMFLSDADARPEGSASPDAHLWDTGAEPVAELGRVMQVRARVLGRFGADNIPEGAPMSTLEDVLVPVYLMHRYQTEAAAKVLGGQRYTFALRGDGQAPVTPIPPDQQRRALNALLTTIDPQALVLPQRILALLPPPAFGYERTREDFKNRTGLTFDPLGAAESAAGLTVRLILNPERAARLVEQHAMTSAAPGLEEVIDTVLDKTWRAGEGVGLAAEVRRTVDSVVLYDLMSLAANDSAPPQVRAIALQELVDLRGWCRKSPATFRNWAAARIDQFEKNEKEITVPKPLEEPPGQPIGCAGMFETLP